MSFVPKNFTLKIDYPKICIIVSSIEVKIKTKKQFEFWSKVDDYREAAGT